MAKKKKKEQVFCSCVSTLACSGDPHFLYSLKLNKSLKVSQVLGRREGIKRLKLYVLRLLYSYTDAEYYRRGLEVVT